MLLATNVSQKKDMFWKFESFSGKYWRRLYTLLDYEICDINVDLLIYDWASELVTHLNVSRDAGSASKAFSYQNWNTNSGPLPWTI